MTVPVQIPRNVSIANGVTTTFPYQFRVLRAADLRVTVEGQLQTLGVHYTVDGVGNPTGGNINFIGGNVPASGARVLRRRLMPFQRADDFATNGDLLASEVNANYDAAVMMIQQLAASALQLVESGNGDFVWDALGSRIANVGTGLLAGDAVNLGQVLELVEAGGSGGLGVTPVRFDFLGDGVETSFLMPDVDVLEPALFDAYIEGVPDDGKFVGLRPALDYTVEIDPDGLGAFMRFATPPGNNVRAYAVLRGYARPYAGLPPITTLAFGITITNESAITADHVDHHSIIGTTESAPVTITVRGNTGDGDLDWQDGEYFSAVPLGTGTVTFAPGVGVTLRVPAGFLPQARGQNCIVTATCVDKDQGIWLLSGDLLRAAAEPSLEVLEMPDRSVLSTTNIAAGTNKNTYVVPFDMKLRAIADAGFHASLGVVQAAGSLLTIDILRNGVSIFATKPTFDNAENSTLTAATPATFAAGGDMLAKGDVLRLDVTQIGTAAARMLTAYLVGSRV